MKRLPAQSARPGGLDKIVPQTTRFSRIQSVKVSDKSRVLIIEKLNLVSQVNRFELTCEPLCTLWASEGDE